jgi:hypothetical protein
MPTKSELNVLFNNRAAIGGFDLSGSEPSGWYWSGRPTTVGMRGISVSATGVSTAARSAFTRLSGVCAEVKDRTGRRPENLLRAAPDAVRMILIDRQAFSRASASAATWTAQSPRLEETLSERLES